MKKLQSQIDDLVKEVDRLKKIQDELINLCWDKPEMSIGYKQIDPGNETANWKERFHKQFPYPLFMGSRNSEGEMEYDMCDHAMSMFIDREIRAEYERGYDEAMQYVELTEKKNGSE